MSSGELVLELVPEIAQDVIFSIPAHQILFSFVNDADAEAFTEWWESQGATAWSQWIIGNETGERLPRVR